MRINTKNLPNKDQSHSIRVAFETFADVQLSVPSDYMKCGISAWAAVLKRSSKEMYFIEVSDVNDRSSIDFALAHHALAVEQLDLNTTCSVENVYLIMPPEFSENKYWAMVRLSSISIPASDHLRDIARIKNERVVYCNADTGQEFGTEFQTNKERLVQIWAIKTSRRR